MYLLGFDIGGTKTEVNLFQISDQGGDFQVSRKDKISNISSLVSERIPTEREKGYDHYFENLLVLINSVLEKKSLDINEVAGIGIGLPGSVDPTTEIMINGNTQMMIGKDLGSQLRSRLSFEGKISINNDASCFALAEALCGAGLKYKTDYGVPIKNQQSIGIILGTGCGGGLILEGRIINGAKGGGGEVGHTTLVMDGEPCYCGRKGCAEQYLSGSGIEKHFKKLDPSRSLKGDEIFKLALEKDPIAIQVLAEYKTKLAFFLTNLNNFYDPHYFVLGGGVSKQAIIYEGLEKNIGEKMFVSGKVPNVYQHQLSDSAGVLGAALMTL